MLQDYDTQKQTLQQQILEKDTKLMEFQMELERVNTERPDTTNLLATIESDKVAASRAMAQNQELRKQLEEMQLAIVQVVSNRCSMQFILHSINYYLKHTFHSPLY